MAKHSLRKEVSKVAKSTKRHARESYEKLHSAGLGFWIFLGVIFLLGLIFLVEIEQGVVFIVQEYGYYGIFISSAISELLVQPIGPEVPLVVGVLAGFLNNWWILASVLAGSYLGLLIAYFAGKSIGAAGIERITGRKTYEKIKNSRFSGKVLLFVSALTPIPYVPYLAGLWSLSFFEVLVYVALPRTIRLVIVYFFAITAGADFFYWLGI